jgi:hypothetical protein
MFKMESEKRLPKRKKPMLNSRKLQKPKEEQPQEQPERRVQAVYCIPGYVIYV